MSKGRLFAAGVSSGIGRRDYDSCGISIEEKRKRFTEGLQIMNLIWNSEKDNQVTQGKENPQYDY